MTIFTVTLVTFTNGWNAYFWPKIIAKNEVRRVLTAGGPVGRRLDFLMQELNREANTLGSKAAIRELSDASMELKLLIEQIREQVQNLE